MILRKDGSSAVFNIALEKGRGKKGEKNYYYTGDSNLVTHPSTNPAEQGLTSLSGRNIFLVV